MKNHILKYCLLALVFAMSATRIIAQVSPDTVIPPPANWFTLQSWGCDPSDCSNQLAVFGGIASVTTSIAGVCHNGVVVGCSASAYAVNCKNPVLLSTSANVKLGLTKLYGQNYFMDGVTAIDSYYNSNGVYVGGGSILQWCNSTGGGFQTPPTGC